MLVGLEDGLSRWLGERTVHVGHGDAVVLHTDGLTEAMDQEDRCYGLERLEACLRRCRGLGARQVREAVVEDLRLFRGRRALADDVTVVVVRRR
jgi:sigma-B regulation protein RsbU (phosphoserine phosphatase)